MDSSKNRATVADFIARAKQRKSNEYRIKEIYVKSIDANLVATKLKETEVLNMMDRINEDDTMVNSIDVYKELIYKSVEELQSKDLKDEFELAEPYDIVTEVFDIGEIPNIGNQILSIYGFDNMGNDIKN